jgi:RNase P protein component
MFRVAYRRSKSQLPQGLDLLVAPRRGAVAASLDELVRSLLELAEKVAGRLASRKGKESG